MAKRKNKWAADASPTARSLRLFTMQSDGDCSSIHSLALRYEFAANCGQLHTEFGLPHFDLDHNLTKFWSWKGVDDTHEGSVELDGPDMEDVYDFLVANPEYLKTKGT